MTILENVPDSCVGAGIVGVAGLAIATAWHNSSDDGKAVPNCCVAGGLVLGGSAAILAAHHGKMDGLPPMHCIAGGIAGLAATAYGVSEHSPSKVPTQCIVSGVVGIGLLILGTKLVQG